MASDPGPGVPAPTGTLFHPTQEPAICTLIFSLLLLVDLTTQAATLGFPALPGGGLVYRQVRNIHEWRFADLIERETGFNYNAAALTTILEKTYGTPLDEQAVIQGMLAHADPEIVRTRGFSVLDMKRCVESMGIRARDYRIETAQLEQLETPAIVLMEIRGYKHFVVLQRIQSEYVYAGGPALEHKRCALTEFAKGWDGITFIIVDQRCNRGNSLLTPPEPLTAHNRLDRSKPVRDAELMEFGSIRSDFS